MNLCLYQGTFNPIHYAHLRVAEYVIKENIAEKILFIPAFIPPHKTSEPDMSEHRFKMLQLAIKPYPEFEISDILKPFDKVCSLDEVRYKCKNELKKPVLDDITKIIKKDNNIFGTPINDIVTIDGLRIIFADGFALIRQSNTEPVFTLRFEALTKDKALNCKNVMISLLDECIANFN